MTGETPRDMLTIRNCFREEKGRKGMKKHVWAIIVLLLITIGCVAEAGTLLLLVLQKKATAS